MRRGVLHMVLAFAVSLSATGCWNPFRPDGDGNGNGDYGDRTSPKRLLDFFAKAYTDKSVERYAESLDESFTFTFMADDYGVAGVDSFKPYWGSTEDIERTTAMFTSPKTLNISFNFNLPVMDWYECPDSIVVGDEEQPIDAACSIWKPDIQVTVDESEAEPTTYWVNASWVEVTVIQDRKDSNLWTILRIRESPGPP
jgi:hypothetical protein